MTQSNYSGENHLYVLGKFVDTLESTFPALTVYRSHLVPHDFRFRRS